MKLSLNWLKSYFIEQPDWDLVWSKLTMAGIEVEGVESVAPAFSGIIVGEVISCKKHPDADKLSLCEVNTGDDEVLQIVCGAPNVKAGIKVPCAKVRAILPDGLHISERKMRGVMSYGMLCSGNEIAYPNEVDGLLVLSDDAPVGMNIREYLGLDDQIVEFKITPNRGDCLSVKGILREITALTEYKLKSDVDLPFNSHISDQVQVIIDVPKECPNYCSLIIRAVDNRVKLPDYIIKRLAHSGIRTISPIVDIANYVMLELGQPLHAFDLASVGTQLQVRMAKNTEQLKLLDGKVVDLINNTLVICDSQNRVSAIAGVMGGFASGVTPDTCDLVLESAYFTPAIISGKTKQYGVNSDAAYRYERGVDPELQNIAIKYAANLIVEYCGGQIGIINQIVAAPITEIKPIILKYNELRQSIGISIANVEINNLLHNLGFKIISNSDEFQAIPPSYRFDITIKQDIIEEVARIYGYDNIEPVMPQSSLDLNKLHHTEKINHQLKQRLLNLGYHEIVSYAFIEEKYEALLGYPNTTPVKLQNPIAGLNVMRSSLLADLIKVLINNLHRGHKQIKLFELARVFHGELSEQQPLKLAGLLHGVYAQSMWNGDNRAADFFDLKHVVEQLLSGWYDVSFTCCTDYSAFHPGRCAKIYARSEQGPLQLEDQLPQEIGIIGQLHPKLGQKLGLNELPYMFELDLSFIKERANLLNIKPVSKFQKVERDLAFLMESNIMVGEILELIAQIKIENLVETKVFDVYQQPNLNIDDKANNLKSVGFNFVFQSQHKTLTDEEINQSIKIIIDKVEHRFRAKLR
ncbi:MAG: phenylalanine--tRNA ligase subunit beta [Burkholderiales bacterium]|nr:phenylalanine--tRNA ligase subunit beta [Burkholderiales bacterium]